MKYLIIPFMLISCANEYARDTLADIHVINLIKPDRFGDRLVVGIPQSSSCTLVHPIVIQYILSDFSCDQSSILQYRENSLEYTITLKVDIKEFNKKISEFCTKNHFELKINEGYDESDGTINIKSEDCSYEIFLVKQENNDVAVNICIKHEK
ncbi:MAG: hypothetical protein RL095_3162 [Verrucomicrobiota bacterium]|jgi:hypothetical protein